MHEEIIKNDRLGEQYYQYTMPNGLTVLVYPMPQKQGVFALLGAKIGSTTGDFMLGEKKVTIPAGVAHFLEHKLFENENEDAFSLFAKTGANANAYTSFDKTCYLFSASINIEQSLKTLINFVNTPHFTKETVEKEQGIIGQEIKMYDDNADWVLATMTLRALYKKLPLREDIAGTVASIAKITPELLYDCYNAFYRPENMALSIAGNVTPEQVMRICEQEYQNVTVPSEKVSIIAVEEPEEIDVAYVERKMSICAPQFCLGYKEKPHPDLSRRKDELICVIIMELLGGETSSLYRRLYDKGLVNDMFDVSALDTSDYLCVTISGESENITEVVDEIYAEIENMKANGIDSELFAECKRALLGTALCRFDSIEGTATRMLYSFFKNCPLYGDIEEIEGITKEDVERKFRSMFNRKNSALAVIKPDADKGVVI